MQDGVIPRFGTSHSNPSSSGNIHNGGSTAKLYTSRKSTPPTSESSTPAKKASSPSLSPSHHYHGLGPSGPNCNGEFKLCGYDVSEEFSGNGSGSTTSSGGTSPADIFGILGFWLKLRHDLTSVPWEQMRAVRMKNARAAPGCAYIPTEVEHIANVITHGAWVLPSVYAGVTLLWRSSSAAQLLAAIIYGLALMMLFFVSTFFHCVFYCNRNRPLKDMLHRCDRAMIYIFIAGSYYPWLSLGHTTHPEIVSVIKWCVWVMAILGIIYQQIFHERYKCLETFFYILIGLGPSMVIVFWGHEFTGMAELKLGGFLYIVGIVFFKSDGIFPFAHAIWHLFVVIAAAVHYFAILTYLYPMENDVT
ncbi:monocyte to macrophage differentiation factor [Malaya genurostris]|uniref:monocyte to macrophage differentiation factor n=1 Tax=Malaya genurostris TaxID=325434 RepID=UPI0026F3FB76|nr:monocyte to macrophage differentiation factor [Malaya genurostris]XP_058466807.1 monocyte to macrophage differentiation factor [Malaya genurostris]